MLQHFTSRARIAGLRFQWPLQGPAPGQLCSWLPSTFFPPQHKTARSPKGSGINNTQGCVRAAAGELGCFPAPAPAAKGWQSPSRAPVLLRPQGPAWLLPLPTPSSSLLAPGSGTWPGCEVPPCCPEPGICSPRGEQHQHPVPQQHPEHPAEHGVIGCGCLLLIWGLMTTKHNPFSLGSD